MLIYYINISSIRLYRSLCLPACLLQYLSARHNQTLPAVASGRLCGLVLVESVLLVRSSEVNAAIIYIVRSVRYHRDIQYIMMPYYCL